MSVQQQTARGKPLAMLALVAMLWVSGRAMTWETPFAVPEIVAEAGQVLLAGRDQSSEPQESRVETEPMQDHAQGAAALPPLMPWVERPLPNAPALQPPLVAPLEPTTGNTAQPSSATAAGHQLLWMAALAHMPVPKELAQRMVGAASPPELQPDYRARGDRWTLDVWAFWREGSGSALVSQGRVPSYGASQAGAVLRYRLAPQSKQSPNAYLRAYRALIDGGENELAAGLSARPLPILPLRAHGELRATRVAGETRLRPSAFVTTELPPFVLPLGLQGEAYAQAGYVGGKGRTGFADGQLHVMRSVKDFDLGKLSLGGAAWGGAQKGSRRVDLGPSVRLDVTLGETPARLSVDWRERVAGNAEPDSGVAVTLSTRF